MQPEQDSPRPGILAQALHGKACNHCFAGHARLDDKYLASRINPQGRDKELLVLFPHVRAPRPRDDQQQHKGNYYFSKRDHGREVCCCAR
jgi:hypothetical protein